MLTVRSLSMLVVAVWAASGCNRTPDTGSPATGAPAIAAPAGSANASPMGSQVVAQIGLGQLSGHTYTHEHFKLSVAIPEDWYIQKRNETDQLVQTGTTFVQDANTRAAVQAAQQRSLALLSAFRHPPGTPVPFNHNMILMAENVATLPGIKRGEDYLKIMGQTLRQGMSLKIDVDPVETGFNIGSLPAERLTTHMQVTGQQVTQYNYATRVGDYVLLITLSYSTDEQRDELQAILESMKAG